MKFFGEEFKEIFTFVVFAVVLVFGIRAFIAQPFVVEGESMYPTFDSGDYLIVDELSYRFTEIERGDVVIFRYPNNPKVFYIKRIIGLPGERVSIVRGIATVTRTDGSTFTVNEPYVVSEDATYTLEATLGPDQYFVMGDNRPKSSDSRVWGPLPKENIIGRAFLRLLPPTELGLFPGAVTPEPSI